MTVDPYGSTRFGYVCGALRVSTDDARGSIGPRAHVTGFLGGLQDVGVKPHVYLAGDQPWAARMGGDGSDAGSAGRRRMLVNDTARLALRPVLQRAAQNAVAPVDVLYERQATFQDIGRAFRRRGAFWVLESNGPFWYEASVERRNLALTRTAKRLELAAYRDADLVVVVSEALKSIIVEHVGRDASDVLVVPNATDPRRFDPAAVAPLRQSSLPTLGFSGYLTHWAGIDLAIEAVSRLRRRRIDVAFTVLGEGPDRAALERAVVDRGLEDRVIFLGRVPWSSVPAHLAGMDIGYSGQRQMSIGAMYHSPQKLYEYMAMGLPVLASDHEDARRLTAAGGGWTFGSDDVDHLTEVLATAVVDSQERARRADLARRTVLADHTWSTRVGGLLSEIAARGGLSTPP